MKKTMIALSAALTAVLAFAEVKVSEEYPEFNNGDPAKGSEFIQSIKVLSPRYCSNVKGDVTVVFEAKGMTRVLARCWQQGGEWGKDAVLADLGLDKSARGEFVFHADRFPHGPLNIRLEAVDGKGLKDYCELQVYNLGGIAWKEGIPKKDPPGAKGMKLVYQDDFDGPRSHSARKAARASSRPSVPTARASPSRFLPTSSAASSAIARREAGGPSGR